MAILAIKVKDPLNQGELEYYEWTPTTGWSEPPKCQAGGELYIVFWHENPTAAAVVTDLTMECDGVPFIGKTITIPAFEGAGIEFNGVMPSEPVTITCKAYEGTILLDSVFFEIQPLGVTPPPNGEPPPSPNGEIPWNTVALIVGGILLFAGIIYFTQKKKK